MEEVGGLLWNKWGILLKKEETPEGVSYGTEMRVLLWKRAPEETLLEEGGTLLWKRGEGGRLLWKGGGVLLWKREGLQC